VWLSGTDARKRSRFCGLPACRRFAADVGTADAVAAIAIGRASENRHEQESTMKLLRIGTTGAAALAFLAAALLASSAEAKRKKKAGGAAGGAGASVVRTCVDDYKSGVQMEETGHLIAAREKFVRCSKAACGSPLKQACTTRFTQLDSDIPSVVPVATNAEGAPRFDVEVKMDGELLTSKLDGHAWQLDPGRHEMTFSADGEVFSSQELLIVQGQRNRAVQATFGAPPAAPTRRAVMTKPKKTAVAAADAPPPAPPPPGKVKQLPPAAEAAKQIAEREEAEKEARGPEVTVATTSAETSSSKLPYILGAAGLASIGTGAAFIYWGRKDNSNLSSCSTDVTNCPQSAVDHVHRMYLIGNVALGVGVAALGAAYFVHAHDSATKETRAEEAYRLDVVPTNAGAVASVSGSF